MVKRVQHWTFCLLYRCEISSSTTVPDVYSLGLVGFNVGAQIESREIVADFSPVGNGGLVLAIRDHRSFQPKRKLFVFRIVRPLANVQVPGGTAADVRRRYVGHGQVFDVQLYRVRSFGHGEPDFHHASERGIDAVHVRHDSQIVRRRLRVPRQPEHVHLVGPDARAPRQDEQQRGDVQRKIRHGYLRLSSATNRMTPDAGKPRRKRVPDGVPFLSYLLHAYTTREQHHKITAFGATVRDLGAVVKGSVWDASDFAFTYSRRGRHVWERWPMVSNRMVFEIGNRIRNNDFWVFSIVLNADFD